jgi:hypothetical protein
MDFRRGQGSAREFDGMKERPWLMHTGIPCDLHFDCGCYLLMNICNFDINRSSQGGGRRDRCVSPF